MRTDFQRSVGRGLWEMWESAIYCHHCNINGTCLGSVLEVFCGSCVCMDFFRFYASRCKRRKIKRKENYDFFVVRQEKIWSYVKCSI